MTLAAVPMGMRFPRLPADVYVTAGTGGTLDAATEKVAMVGRVHISGRPTAAKTISAAGGGSIAFRTAAVTFADGATSVDVGIQDVDTVNGPRGRGDDVFDVKATLVGGGGGIAANSWNVVVMTSGSKAIAHGDLVAITFDMATRGGTDSVVITVGPSVAQGSSTNAVMPFCSVFNGGVWQSASFDGVPNCVITFDDGTIGTIDATVPISATAAEAFQDTTNPDERGLIFQVPWDCKIDALFAAGGINSSAADFTLSLYSDPTGTPALLASVAVLAEQLGGTFIDRAMEWALASEVSLSKNTDYCVAMRATGSASSRLHAFTLGDAAYRALLPGGTTLKKATRDGGSGAFAAESPAITMYQVGVRISQLDDGTGPGEYVPPTVPGDHVRSQCRDSVVALLTGLTTTGSNVFGGRPETRPLQDSELPGLLVYTTETESEAASGQRNTRRMVETCNLIVDGYARGTGDLDKTLDKMEKEVRVALAANPTLSGKAKDLVYFGSVKEDAEEAEQPTWRNRMTFTLEYHIREDVPDTALA